MSNVKEVYMNNENSLMIIDDDDVFRNRLITLHFFELANVLTMYYVSLRGSSPLVQKTSSSNLDFQKTDCLHRHLQLLFALLVVMKTSRKSQHSVVIECQVVH